MTPLPNAVAARVEDVKARDYLLNAAHPQNGGKAAFFTSFGFQSGNWRDLSAALKIHPVTNPAVSRVASPHGIKWVVRCTLASPDGRNPCITTVWLIDTGEPPRLVTAYP